MSVTAEKTVRELALENPSATRVFEKLGIDYCCGGNKSLEEACRAANLSMDEVIDSLEMADQAARAQKDPRLAERISSRTDLPHQEHPPQVHAGGTGTPRSSFGQSLLRPRQEPSRVATGPLQLSSIVCRADHAHDERRERLVSVHREDGGSGHPAGTGGAAAVRQRAESRLHDGARARFGWQRLAGDSRSEQRLLHSAGRLC